jgi:hypothetical protein
MDSAAYSAVSILIKTAASILTLRQQHELGSLLAKWLHGADTERSPIFSVVYCCILSN